jgi:hypothetical protein
MGAFTARLRQDCPPLARIDAIQTSRLGWPPGGFTIRHSAGGAMDTQIVPDAATCPACLAEMRDPASAAIAIRLSTAPTAAAFYHYPRHALRPSGHGDGAFPPGAV